MKTTGEQARINRKCAKRKQWLIENNPICIFCLHLITQRQIEYGEVHLCHKIRRSDQSSRYSREELQTMDLNTGLGHPDCHDMYDNDPENAVLLPGFPFIMNDIKKIDINIYDKQKLNYGKGQTKQR